jgi:hypothetical protein
MHAVAQKLHDRGIEVRWPKYADGCVTWECHHDGPPAECARAVADTIVPILTHGIGTGAGSAGD